MAVGSITSWDKIERLFLTKYDMIKTPSTIVQELSSIKMNLKENMSDFDHRFLALLKKLRAASRSTDEILCGFYLSCLPTTAVVFIMNKYLQTLNENLEAT